MSPPRLICVGEIRGAFGVRGEARIASFTDTPKAIFSYGPLLDAEGGVRLTVAEWRPIKDGFAARAKEVDSRETAEAMKGQRLYASREALPEPDEDEFYQADLVGCAVRHIEGADLGSVRAVVDFGGGPLLEIAPPPGRGASWHLPFTRDFVPRVDLDARRIDVDPPEGLEPG